MWFRASMVARRWGVLGWVLVVIAAVATADPPVRPTQWTVLELKGGRVLHNVKLISDETDSIVVRADEGLVKVAKSTLPDAVAVFFAVKALPPGPTEMMMVPFNGDPANAVRPQDPTEKAVVNAGDRKLFKGCTIVGFQPRVYRRMLGCAEVTVRNDTDTPIEVSAGDFTCIATGLGPLPGRFMVIEGDPSGRKLKEVIPPHGDVEDILAFSAKPLEITGVQWSP
jgi:hypothetical protein